MNLIFNIFRYFFLKYKRSQNEFVLVLFIYKKLRKRICLLKIVYNLRKSVSLMVKYLNACLAEI